MFWHVPPWVYPVLDSLHFLDLSVSFPTLGEFSALISSHIFSGPFSLFSLWAPYNLKVGAFNVFPEVSETVLLSFHSFFFILFCSSDLQESVFQLTYSFFCLIHSAIFFKNYLFIYFWLRWVFVAAHGLSLVAVSGGYSLLRCLAFSLQWLLSLRSMDSRCVGFSSCSAWAQ